MSSRLEGAHVPRNMQTGDRRLPPCPDKAGVAPGKLISRSIGAANEIT